MTSRAIDWRRDGKGPRTQLSRMTGSWQLSQTSDGPVLADFCRMVLPEPVVRQTIGKSIETVGRTGKSDPLSPVANVSFRQTIFGQFSAILGSACSQSVYQTVQRAHVQLLKRGAWCRDPPR